MKNILIFITMTIFLTGCKEDCIVKESTPKYTDVTNIVIDGKQISALEYRDLYCINKVKETFQDEQRCGEAISFALDEARKRDMDKMFEGRPPLTRMETMNDRYQKQLREEAELKNAIRNQNK